MRDIRADLRERLEAEHAAFKVLEEQLAASEDRMVSMQQLLELEEARLASVAISQPNGPVIPTESIDHFLVKAVQRGVSDKEELRDAAIRAGYFTDSKQAPGRVVHAKLMNLLREEQIAKAGEGFVPKPK